MSELLARIRRLPREQPITDSVNVSGRDQKDHWISWLEDYHTAGFYKRTGRHAAASFAYNHLKCPEMILWLAEAVGSPKVSLERAAAIIRASRNAQNARTCAAVRSVLRWDWVSSLL
ncbi:MAG: hypothetical protein IT452_13750 [Planctomycetia bacterium]|nr:hypothetical protein [Planctomycetia bacterium]